MSRVEGVEYTCEAVDQIRQELIEIRNDALGGPAFNPTAAVMLSHVIAYLDEYSEILNDPRGFDEGWS